VKRFTADFETATWIPDETWVWAWALCDIEEPTHVEVGNSIQSFFERIKKEANPYIYFHNLKFDGEFLIFHIMKNLGFEHVESKEKRTGTFSTLISDMGLFYSIEVYFEVGKKTKKVTFIDSLKIINQSVESMPKTFKIEENKLEIDYNAPREKGHILTGEEEAYIKNDVVIVAKALSYLFNMGLTKMTAGSNALSEYKEITRLNRFRSLYKPLNYEIDKDIRRAYRGGFTYLNPVYKNKEVKEGEVLDVNSLYPSVMYKEMLPFGEPFFYEGEYQEDKVYPLYIQRLTCSFKN
jgi:DNA polymerase type B, organellar and viral.